MRSIFLSLLLLSAFCGLAVNSQVTINFANTFAGALSGSGASGGGADCVVQLFLNFAGDQQTLGVIQTAVNAYNLSMIPDVNARYIPTTSTVAGNAAADGLVDFGVLTSSWTAADSTAMPGVTIQNIGTDATILIINPGSSYSGAFPITATTAQIGNQFTPPDTSMQTTFANSALPSSITKLAYREPTSAMRQQLEALVGVVNGQYQPTSIQLTSDAQMLAYIGSNSNSLGYISYAAFNAGPLPTGVYAVAFNGVVPSYSTIKSGAYQLLSRPVAFAMDGPADDTQEGFLDWLIQNGMNDIINLAFVN